MLAVSNSVNQPKSSLVLADLYLEIPSGGSLTNSSSKVPLYLCQSVTGPSTQPEPNCLDPEFYLASAEPIFFCLALKSKTFAVFNLSIVLQQITAQEEFILSWSFVACLFSVKSTKIKPQYSQSVSCHCTTLKKLPRITQVVSRICFPKSC